jgi:diacylglycerol kinase family enzyme
MGGGGTLYEALNATVNRPNMQIAAYPFGRENNFLQYFGADKAHFFSSIRSQVFSNVIPIDAIRCGHRHGMSHGLVGLEAIAGKTGLEILTNKTVFNENIVYVYAALKAAYSRGITGQEYTVDLDGQQLDGNYISILIANGPCYGKNLSPAVDAHPNDGLLDIYMMKKMPRYKLLLNAYTYLNGGYKKIPGYVSHYRGKKITITSADTMCLLIDDLLFYEKAIEYEVLPYAVDFVCPGGVSVDKLPRIYEKRPVGEGGGL